MNEQINTNKTETPVLMPTDLWCVAWVSFLPADNLEKLCTFYCGPHKTQKRRRGHLNLNRQVVNLHDIQQHLELNVESQG